MTEAPSSIETNPPLTEQPETGQPSAKARVDGIIVWAIVSMACLVYIAFGSVEARIWRFGQLRVESKSLTGIWSYEINNLPQTAHQWILTSSFVIAITVFAIGVITALWFLLDNNAGDDVTIAAHHAPSRQSDVDPPASQSGT